MKKAITIWLLFLAVGSCLSQGYESSIISQTGYFNVVPDINDVLASQPSKAYYESDDMNIVRIVLDEKSYSTPVLGRIDFYNKALQVDLTGEYFAVELENFHRLEFYNKQVTGEIDTTNYVNAKLVLGAARPALLEVLLEGRFPLFKERRVKFERANYNKALDIGSKEDKHIVKIVIYTWSDDKLIELPLEKENKLKKELRKLFGEEVEHLTFLENEDALVNYFKLKNSKND